MNHPLFLILVVALLTGCAGHPALEHPRYAPTIVPAVVNESPATRGSSLYSTATEVMLFEDVKASRVGDIVSVLLAERTNASKSNDSSVTKSNEATIGNPLLGGEQRDVLGSFRGWDFNLGFGLESDQAFSGAGASNQSNQLTGTIAAANTSAFGASFEKAISPAPIPSYPLRLPTPVLVTAARAGQRRPARWVGCHDFLTQHYNRTKRLGHLL